MSPTRPGRAAHGPASAGRRLLLASDALVIAASMAACFPLQAWLRGLLPGLLRQPPQFRDYASLAVLTLPLWLGLAVLLGLDRTAARLPRWPELTGRLVAHHGLGLVGLSVVLFLTQSVINRSLVALFMACTFVLMLAERLLVTRWLRYQHRVGQLRDRILLVGPGAGRVREFAQRAATDALPPLLLGRLGPPADPDPALPHLGDVSRLDELLHAEAIDQVVVFPPYPEPAALDAALEKLAERGVRVAFAVPEPAPALGTPRVSSLHDVPVLDYEMHGHDPEALAVKHVFDLLIGGAALVLVSPLLVGIAVAVLIGTGRPVFFAQERVGLHGRRFRMLKFRTMVRDAEQRRDSLLERNEVDGPAFKLSDDPRVTGLGRWLRRWSLDELPQLVNVVLGSMSLVGPRPLPVAEQQAVTGWRKRRVSMKPGITGLWQVSGRSDLGFEEWMRLDLRYVDEWSLLGDLRILLRTLPAVVSGRGSR